MTQILTDFHCPDKVGMKITFWSGPEYIRKNDKKLKIDLKVIIIYETV